LTFEGILVLVSVSGLFFCIRHQIFATLPAIKKSLHNTLQKIAHAQNGNVSRSTTKITSAATLVQYFINMATSQELLGSSSGMHGIPV